VPIRPAAAASPVPPVDRRSAWVTLAAALIIGSAVALPRAVIARR
jgi:hypothetical protein